jgi:hypothetical protein
MRARHILGAVCVVLSACAEIPVRHVLGTEGASPEQLAVVAVMTNEVRLLELDGRRDVPNPTEFNFYLAPGPHKFVFDLNWSDLMCAGGVCLPVGTKSSVQRAACIRAEPRMIYHFYGRKPGPNWELHVSKRPVGTSDGADIDHTCRE